MGRKCSSAPLGLPAGRLTEGGSFLNSLSVARRIADKVQAFPDKTIFRFLERGESEAASFTYGALDEGARGIAAALIDRRLTGERLLLVFEPGPEFALALLGALYAGSIGVPAPAPRAGASLERLEGIAAGAKARILLTTARVKAELEAKMAADSPLRTTTILALDEIDLTRAASACPGLDIDPGATLLIQYTSGSTLAPRGVVLSSEGVAANIDFACRGIGFGSCGEDVFVNWMPHYHDMGLIGNLLLPLAKGHESVHLPPLAFVQQPARWLQAIARYRGTASGGPPLAYDSCVARIPDEVVDGLDLSSWRIAFCGAEPVFSTSLDAFRTRFARTGLAPGAVFSVYGMAEVAVYAAGSPPPGGETVPAAAAAERAPCHLDREASSALRIVSPGGALLPDGEEGEIWISGPSVAAGYLDDAESTRSSFHHRLVPDDGRTYLRTGDLGRIEGAVLKITGRIKDVVIRNGVNIAASDIERLGAAAGDGLDANAAAAFQGDGPDAPIALMFEKPRGPWDESGEAELIRAVRRSVMAGLGIALDKVQIVGAGSLPRTTSGKIQRARARTLWAEAKAGRTGNGG